MKRLIVTDSTADIPRDIIQQLGIKVIPVNVHLDGRLYKDGEDLTTDQFYAGYDNFKEMRSEAVKYEEYALSYMQMTQQYDEILIIHCSRHVSETYNVAVKVHEEFRTSHRCKIEIIDSKSCSMGLGLIVIAAARAAIKGVSFIENVALVNNMVPQMCSYMAIPTMKYLKKGKKIGGFKALMGIALGVKPVLEFDDDGKFAVKTKLFGKQKNMILAMMDSIRKDIGSDPITLAIVHSREKGVVDSLKGVFESSFKCKNIYVGCFGPSIGINTGPEATAVMFYKDYE